MNNNEKALASSHFVGGPAINRQDFLSAESQILLQEGDYSIQGKEDSKKNAPLAGIYWGIAVAVFLLLSFLTNAWDKTWIVWPVAGVTYGVVIGVITMRRRRE